MVYTQQPGVTGSRVLTMSLPLLLLVLLLLVPFFSSTTGAVEKKPNSPPRDLLHTACAHASYPSICLRTLSSYSGPANTPSDLARAAVKVSLARARKTSDYMIDLKSQSKRQQGPVTDCVEQIGDSVDELRETLSELQHLGAGGRNFVWQMNNAETWVSAALTNEYTCLDGFKDVDGGKVRPDVKAKITDVARVTSNALYLINRLYHVDSRWNFRLSDP